MEKLQVTLPTEVFSSPKNNIVLEELDIINAVCPRSVKQMREKLQDEEFCHLQKRRASTEARISILKYNYFQNPLSPYIL